MQTVTVQEGLYMQRNNKLRGFPGIKSQPFKYVGKHITSHSSPIFEVWDTYIINFGSAVEFETLVPCYKCTMRAQYLVLN